MRVSTILAAACTYAAMTASAAAITTIVSFDNQGFVEAENLQGVTKSIAGLPDITFSADPNDGAGVPTIFNTNCNGLRFDFARPDCSGNDGDLSSPFPGDGIDTLEAFNALILNESDDPSGDNGPNDDPSGGMITLTFGGQVQLLRLDLLDLGDGNELDGLTIMVDDVTVLTGATVAENGFFRTHTPDESPFGTVFKFTFEGSGAIDNLVFNTPSDSTVVPVPASLPLLLGAMGMIGWVGRRRR